MLAGRCSVPQQTPAFAAAAAGKAMLGARDAVLHRSPPAGALASGRSRESDDYRREIGTVVDLIFRQVV